MAAYVRVCVRVQCVRRFRQQANANAKVQLETSCINVWTYLFMYYTYVYVLRHVGRCVYVTYLQIHQPLQFSLLLLYYGCYTTAAYVLLLVVFCNEPNIRWRILMRRQQLKERKRNIPSSIRAALTGVEKLFLFGLITKSNFILFTKWT